MTKRKLVIIVVSGVLAGFVLRGWISPEKHSVPQGSPQQGQQQVWTCSMHPQIRQPKPGKCPICFMDLIPVNLEHTDSAERQISFSPQAVKLMEIQTTPVERKFVEAQIYMVGRVDYDETKVKHITAWAAGRIDRLYVDFTGIQVSKGDHMVYLYSPELIGAQAELLQSLEAKKNLRPESSELIAGSTMATLDAAKGKLRLLGLTERQIQDIEETGSPVDHITIYAPVGGIVIEKMVNEGMYVETGTKIYTIADLSEVWVKLDAYESDLLWIRYGQEVEFTAEAYPGEIFKGKISFISPTLDPQTRTFKLRVNVKNQDEKLKPEMFVHAVVRSGVAMGGMVMDPNMAGKWICPMHSSVVKDAAGKCDICGMDLVTTELLGYVRADAPKTAPLVIPATSPLITGKKAVVYVQLPDANKPTFEGREITLGPRAGNYYIVEEGLTEGEIVVTNGNFKIDASLQIQAKPSMMSPQGAEKPIPPEHRH